MFLLLNGAVYLVMEDVEKAELFNAFLPWSLLVRLTFISSKKVFLQTIRKVWRKKHIPLVKEDQVREHLNRLDIGKSMGPNGMHHKC